MANELNIRLDPVLETGLTVVCLVLKPDGSSVAQVTLTEVSGTRPGYYTGAMPGAIPANRYLLDFRSGSATGALLGNSVLHWDGVEEIDLSSIVRLLFKTALPIP